MPTSKCPNCKLYGPDDLDELKRELANEPDPDERDAVLRLVELGFAVNKYCEKYRGKAGKR